MSKDFESETLKDIPYKTICLLLEKEFNVDSLIRNSSKFFFTSKYSYKFLKLFINNNFQISLSFNDFNNILEQKAQLQKKVFDYFISSGFYRLIIKQSVDYSSTLESKIIYEKIISPLVTYKNFTILLSCIDYFPFFIVTNIKLNELLQKCAEQGSLELIKHMIHQYYIRFYSWELIQISLEHERFTLLKYLL